MERGLSIQDMRRMQIGQVADFCMEYNEREEKSQRAQEKKEKGQTKRKATAADVKAYFG